MEWGQGMKVAYDQDMLKILRNKLKLKKNSHCDVYHCQHNKYWNHLRDKLPGMPVRNYLD